MPDYFKLRDSVFGFTQSDLRFVENEEKIKVIYYFSTQTLLDLINSYGIFDLKFTARLVDGSYIVSTNTITIVSAPIYLKLSNTPPAITGSNSIDITVTGSNVWAYKYSLDGAAWGDAFDPAVPIHMEGLGDGVHVLNVIGMKGDGLWQIEEEQTSIVWTVDTVPPLVNTGKDVAWTNQPAFLTGHVTDLFECTYSWEALNNQQHHYGRIWNFKYEWLLSFYWI